jgi:hypothetical protein
MRKTNLDKHFYKAEAPVFFDFREHEMRISTKSREKGIAAEVY